jgi:predicted HD superfamily hydrolase involved in NAD metabolism
MARLAPQGDRPRLAPPGNDEYDLSGVDADVAPRLVAMVSARRLWHSKQVAALAESLARRRGLDADAARRAGLLHDLYRGSRDRWPELAAEEGIALPAWAGDDLGHLHGPLAAIAARREFGLPEPWCRAIAGHTTALPNMSPEVMVLFVADHAAEGRRQPEVPHWRELAHQDIAAATEEMLTHLLGSLLQQGQVLWPPTVEARNELVLRRKAGQVW